AGEEIFLWMIRASAHICKSSSVLTGASVTLTENALPGSVSPFGVPRAGSGRPAGPRQTARPQPTREPTSTPRSSTMSSPWWHRALRPLAPPIQRSPRNPAPARRCRPHVEPLEDRLAPAVITVTSTNDDLDAPSSEDGTASLREAITSINNGADFNADI